MIALDVFSGIGMHAYGFRLAGIAVAGFCEIDPFARAVLAKNFPGVPIHDDVKTLTASHVRTLCGGRAPDLITGGFPCTDVSVAGKGAGIDKGTRSGLWRELFRIIRGLRPMAIVIENVPALRTRGYDRIADALARIGYAIESIVVGARHSGAPHKRDRVWIVGRLGLADDHGLRQQQSGGGIAKLRGRTGDESTRSMADLRGERCQRREGNAAECDSDGAAAGRPEGINCVTGHDSSRPLAHAAGGRLRANRGASNGGGHADECGAVGLEHADESGCEELHAPGIAAMPGLGDRRLNAIRWPARPGQPQYQWEESRLVKFEVGGAASGDASGLVRVADGNTRRLVSRQNKESLKALGNGNPWIVPYLIGKWLMANIESAKAAG